MREVLARLRHLLALVLPRDLGRFLGVRRVTPRDGVDWPGPEDLRVVPVLDTGGHGYYRPDHRQQDPSKDPQEPGDGEGSGQGEDHGWCNCTLASGAMALEFHTRGGLSKWGGHLRHRQGDQSGGTDLYDLREAWASYGEDLQVRSGRGWDVVKADRADGRFLVVQGVGNVPGSATFDGGHACALGPETNADGEWLFGDPLASGWQWVKPGAIRDWMEAWDADCSWARTAAHPPEDPDPEPPDPEPPPTPTPPPPPPGYADGYAAGLVDGGNRTADAVFRSWWEAWPPGTAAAHWDLNGWDAPAGRGRWAAPWPLPLEALLAARTPATWDGSAWTAAAWRG